MQSYPTCSQLESPASPPTARPPPPTNYTPSGYRYHFTNFGLPVLTDHHEYYELTSGITWEPHTPTNLILSMNNTNLIKVGLEPGDAKTLNNIMFDMQRALPLRHQSIELEFLTHNSLLFMQITDQTNVQLVKGDYIYFTSPSMVQRWRTRSMNAESLKVSIDGVVDDLSSSYV